MGKQRGKLAIILAAALILNVVSNFKFGINVNAAVIPKLTMVTQPVKEYKSNQRISFTVTSPNYNGKVEYRVILYNGTTKKTSELWKTPSTGYYYKSWQPSGSYKFTINWPAAGMKPGAYSLTVLVRRVGARTPYDSYVKTNTFWIADSGFPLLIGNSAEQNSDGSTIVKQGDWLYYYDYTDKSLEMVKYDGTGKKIIYKSPVKYITISGDWVYYVATVNNRDIIKKVRLDGTENTEVYRSVADTFYMTHLQIYGVRVYSIYAEGIEYTNIYGGIREMIHTGMVETSMRIYNDRLYFTLIGDNFIRTTDLNGKDRIRITNVPAYRYAFLGDWVYFTNGNDGKKLYRTNLSGEKYMIELWVSQFNGEQGIKDQTLEKVVDAPMRDFLIKDGWVYYSELEDQTIHKVRMDGSGDVKLTQGPGDLDDVIGDWVLYTYNNVRYRVKTDGTGQQKLFN